MSVLCVGERVTWHVFLSVGSMIKLEFNFDRTFHKAFEYYMTAIHFPHTH